MFVVVAAECLKSIRIYMNPVYILINMQAAEKIIKKQEREEDHTQKIM